MIRIQPASIVAIFLMLFSLPAKAEIAVLLHGLLGSSSSWERTGAVNALSDLGWERAGRVQPGGPTGTLISKPLREPRGNRLLYLADIPTLIPLEQQAELLEQVVDTIMYNHPEESIYLIGHSAGGVVSRMTAVRNQIPNLRAVITIASPHLGSPYADLAYDLATLPYPFRFVPKMLANDKYKELRRSRPMIKGLTLAKPGTLLHWLNRQPHPDIRYISIVRRQPPSKIKNALVPFWSQDMSQVAALSGRTETISTFAPHGITFEDGQLLGITLNHLIVE